METTLLEEKRDRRGYLIGGRARELRGKGNLKDPKPINWDAPICNWAEKKFAEQAKAAGWKITKKGWPDFICYKDDGRFMFVEVKPSKKYCLSSAQKKLFDCLKALGLDVWRWSPDTTDEETDIF